MNELLSAALRAHHGGRLAEAEALYRQSLATDPHDPDALYLLGVLFQQTGRVVDAEGALRQAVAEKPDFDEAYCHLGDALHDLGRYGDAETAYRAAYALNPSLVAASNNLAVTLNHTWRYREALEACERALAIAPSHAEAYANKAIALKYLGQPDKAEAAYLKSLELNPHNAATCCGLGTLLEGQGRNDEALDAFRRALRIRPDLQECRLRMALMLPPRQKDSCPIDADVHVIRSLHELAKGTAETSWPALGEVIGVVQPFGLAYRNGDHTEALARYGDLACRARAAWFKDIHPAGLPLRPPHRRRLRLVIVSGQIGNHSVWNVILHGIMKHLDRGRFEIILYNTSRNETDTAHRARELADQYHHNIPDWLQQAMADLPDVIFYPEIAMDPTTARLATLRLAPLQIAGWGHPITTGLPTIDLFCSGELLERPDADRDYREQLVRLPGTGACSILPAVRAAHIAPSEFGLPDDRGTIRFLICQQAAKFDPAFDTLYPRIARSVPNSRFWFIRDNSPAWTSTRLEARLSASFTDYGLRPDHHLSFIDWLPGEGFLGLMDVMDIFLDTPAFSGYTTAWLALHRGLPVISLEGRFMRQRLASGLLRRIGLTGFIAGDMDDYVLKAAALAADADLRRLLRINLPHATAKADEDTRVVRALETAIFNHLPTGHRHA